MFSKKSDICQQALHGYTLSYVETIVNCSSIQNASGRKKNSYIPGLLTIPSIPQKARQKGFIQMFLYLSYFYVQVKQDLPLLEETWLIIYELLMKMINCKTEGSW